jgi:hypothetical protein
MILFACVIVVTMVVIGVWVWNRNADSSALSTTMTSLPVRSTLPSPSTQPSTSDASVVADGNFLTEVTEVDPSLVAYEKKSGNVALRSLLTDGSAFCSFLKRDGDIDDAMVSVVLGARHVEAQTHLPMSVTTFNAVDAVALLSLCPSLQKSVPTSDMAKIRSLGASLTPPVT